MMKNHYNYLDENKKILLIDTSTVVTNKLKIKLNYLNFDIYIANDIKTVHKYLEEDCITFFGIVCEIDMPKIDNQIEFLKYILSKCATVIVLSSNDDDSIIYEVLTYNIVDYILKSKDEDLDYAAEMMSRIFRYKNYKILLIDENKENQKKLKDFLETLMLTVLISTNKKQSLELIKKYKNICLVLINDNLSSISAKDLIVHIRKEYAKNDLNIVTVVKKNDHEESSQVLKYGANAYVYDDLSKEQVCLVVHNLLDVYENKIITNNTKEQIQRYKTKITKYN